MKKLVSALAVAAALWAETAFADDFAVGDRVRIGSTDDTGVVIAMGQQLTDGGTFIKVHLDRFGAASPNVGVTYDTMVSQVTVIGHGAAAPPRSAVRPSPSTPAGGAAGEAPAIPNPATTKASPALCRQLIRANYPPTGADQTITVNFLSFSMDAQRPYEDIDAHDFAAPYAHGHTVSAAHVHAKYTVLTHFDDPYADDQLRTYDAQFECFKSANGGWLVKMISRLPGGETATYIHKQ